VPRGTYPHTGVVASITEVAPRPSRVFPQGFPLGSCQGRYGGSPGLG